MTESATLLPPVDLECLRRMTSVNSSDFQELVERYLQTTTEYLEKLDRALRAQRAADLEKLAHQCLGASALLGMTAIEPPLRRLEEMGNKREWRHAGDALAQAWNALARIKSYLDACPKGTADA
jgi:HPt (histidine-containing phosphotransfer) domain-containing protein